MILHDQQIHHLLAKAKSNNTDALANKIKWPFGPWKKTSINSNEGH